MVLLKGLVALVTGGSGGIGAAISRQFAAEGAHVIVNYRKNGEGARSAVAAIQAEGGTAEAYACDVASESEVREMLAAILKVHGRIDALVCCAGIVRDQLAASMTVEEFDEVLDVNLRGTFLCSREVIAPMMAARRGSILHVSSISAEAGGKGQCNYAASKAGVLALTRTMALELAPKNIRVNAVVPGLIETNMSKPVRELAGESLLRQIPMRRYGTPQDVAHAAVYLTSPNASYVTGAVLHVSGGLGLNR
jgi:3-oxoacyl-[acyl-carrier protein] reductase